MRKKWPLPFTCDELLVGMILCWELVGTRIWLLASDDIGKFSGWFTVIKAWAVATDCLCSVGKLSLVVASGSGGETNRSTLCNDLRGMLGFVIRDIAVAEIKNISKLPNKIFRNHYSSKPNKNFSSKKQRKIILSRHLPFIKQPTENNWKGSHVRTFSPLLHSLLFFLIHILLIFLSIDILLQLIHMGLKIELTILPRKFMEDVILVSRSKLCLLKLCGSDSGNARSRWWARFSMWSLMTHWWLQLPWACIIP